MPIAILGLYVCREAYVRYSWGNRQRKDFYLVVLFECSLLSLIMRFIYAACFQRKKERKKYGASILILFFATIPYFPCPGHLWSRRHYTKGSVKYTNEALTLLLATHAWWISVIGWGLHTGCVYSTAVFFHCGSVKCRLPRLNALRDDNAADVYVGTSLERRISDSDSL